MNSMDYDLREEKLPMWAQKTIETLRYQLQIERVRADAARFKDGQVDTNTFYKNRNALMREEIPLPKGSAIRFLLNPANSNNYVEARAIEGDNPHVSITCDGTLGIVPQASNVIRIRSNAIY